METIHVSEINPENWTYTSYSDDELNAFVSFGSDPDILSDKFIYFATILDSEQNEVFQKEFETIEAACSYLNNKYSGTWKFINKLGANKNSGGCSTCVAH